MKTNPVEDDEEYVLLDLNGVCSHVDIPANAPYDLSVRVYLQWSSQIIILRSDCDAWLFCQLQCLAVVLSSAFGCSLSCKLFEDFGIVDGYPIPQNVGVMKM